MFIDGALRRSSIGVLPMPTPPLHAYLDKGWLSVRGLSDAPVTVGLIKESCSNGGQRERLWQQNTKEEPRGARTPCSLWLYRTITQVSGVTQINGNKWSNYSRVCSVAWLLNTGVIQTVGVCCVFLDGQTREQMVQRPQPVSECLTDGKGKRDGPVTNLCLLLLFSLSLLKLYTMNIRGGNLLGISRSDLIFTLGVSIRFRIDSQFIAII